MDPEYLTYVGIPKRTRNAISARIKAAIEKYGFDAVRLVSRKYIERMIKKGRLEQLIKDKESELAKLKKSSQ